MLTASYMFTNMDVLSGMIQHMFLKKAGRCERFCTYFAAIWLISSIDEHGYLERWLKFLHNSHVYGFPSVCISILVL